MPGHVFSDHLREAIDAWGGTGHPRNQGIRKFQRAMEHALKDTEVRGHTLPTIHSYLAGRTHPSREWIDVAAGILSVPSAWLAGTARFSDPETEARWRRELETTVDQQEATIRLWVWEFLEEAGWSILALPTAGDFIIDVYRRRGPVAFGVEWHGEWRGRASMANDVEPSVSRDDVAAYARRILGPGLSLGPERSYAEKMAAMHAALAVAYLSEA